MVVVVVDLVVDVLVPWLLPLLPVMARIDGRAFHSFTRGMRRPFDPDCAAAMIDTTLAVDIPGVPEDERVTAQGQGVAFTVMDGSVISDRSLIDEFEAVAKKREIPYQLSILPKGGTDTAAMQRSRGGVRAMTLSVPTRYIHTVTECVHKQDLQAAIDVLAGWLET